MKNKGFSFVELLVAVAILGIVSLPIVSSFALAAKTDAKAYHLSAMNDAADDVMLLLKEIASMDKVDLENPDVVGQKTYESQTDYRIRTAYNAMLSPSLVNDTAEQNEDAEIESLCYQIRYNNYSATLVLTKLEGYDYYSVELLFVHTVSGATLEVNRRGLLEYV